MTDLDGTFAYSSIVTVQIEGKDAISVYPNPTSSSLRINSDHKIGRVEIINAAGQRLYTYGTDSLVFDVDISTWKPGIYIVRVNGVDRKIVKL
jgi:hypothetical protein